VAVLRVLALALAASLAAGALAQNGSDPAADRARAAERLRQEGLLERVTRAEAEGVTVRLKDIARFRGIRSNTLTGTGLVLGLEGTGDSKKIGATVQALTNYLRGQGMDVDPKNLDSRNVALVMVTVELPPFATNGQRLDVTVTSIGDAKSLRNGRLLFTELRSPSDNQTVYATADGSISVGGFGATAGGNQAQKGFLTVGRIPGGAIVERGAPTTTVFDGRMYVELDEPDLTTAHRIQERILAAAPQFDPVALNGGTIQVTLPEGLSPVAAMARLEELTVQTDNAALVVINERTGTIVMGGNVRIAPVAIAAGSINVKVEEFIDVSQPMPFSQGQTAVVSNRTLNAEEEPARLAVVAPNATVADLARIFQELRLKPTDIIAILQTLRQQGALKARVVLQ
jgi:flagellar P-ring protein FlgI